MKKNQSDDEDDEAFIEKYSGPRRAATSKTQTQNVEFKAIHEQLSQLTEKFKLMQDTTNDLTKTVLSQNDTIKNLMTELLQARVDGEKKFKTLISELSSGTQNDEISLDQQEEFLADSFKPKIKSPKPTATFSSISSQDVAGPKMVSAQQFQDYYDSNTLELDNTISGSGGRWIKSDSHREFNNGNRMMIQELIRNIGQTLIASKKPKLHGAPVLSASREVFTPFNQPAKGRSAGNPHKPNNYPSIGNSLRESGAPYPYFDKAFQASREQSASTNSYELNQYEVHKLFPELIQELCNEDDDQDRFEEDHYQPQKKLQKVSLRNGGYPTNGGGIVQSSN